MKKLKLLLVLLIATTVLSGCSLTSKKTSDDTSDTENSSNDNSGGSIVTVDYCEKLTPEIAAEILGGPVERTDADSTTTCTYATTSDDLTNYGVITMVVSGSSKTEAKQLYDSAKSIAYSNKTEDVTGLDANEACWAPDMMQLSILKGDNWIIISSISSKYENAKDGSVAAAKLILEKF